MTRSWAWAGVAAAVLLSCADKGDGSGQQTAGSGSPPSSAGTGGAGVSSAAGSSGAAGVPVAGADAIAGASSAGSSGAPGTAGSGAITGNGGSSGASAGAGGAGAGAAGAAGAGAGGAAGASAVIMSEGCGLDPVPAGDASLEVDGVSRTYLVELPDGYDPNHAHPLILGFHGAGLDGAGFRGYFDLGAVAGAEAVIAYPDALGDPTGWQYGRDIPFAEAVLTQLKSQYCIDEARVFATGHSSGGYFTNALGCRLGNLLRAIAPVSGGVGVRTMCRGMPAVWIAHGASDNIVPTSEGRAARDFWAERNGCDASASMPTDPAPCVAYAGCAAQSPLVYCEFDGNHSPPAFAVEAVWSFFSSL